MIRIRKALLIAAGTCAAIGVAACSDSIKEPGQTTGTGGSGTGGSTPGTGNSPATTGGSGNSSSGGGTGMSSGNVIADSTPCSAECCPTDAQCYSSSAATMAPGAACLATRDNTGQKHVSMRQTWINATAPKGNVGGIVYTVLSGRTELPLPSGAMAMAGQPQCNMNGGALGYGGYMQLSDLYFANGANGMADYDNDYGMTGFATYVSSANVVSDLTNGFCYGTEDWQPDQDNKMYELGPNDMSPQTDFNGNPWPTGLPAPMPLKDANGGELSWHVAPTKAKRLQMDFDLTDQSQRKDLIQKLSSAGDYGMKGFTGVYYYDATTGYQHSYGPLGWVIVYNQDGSTHIAIPARETEFKSYLNDPAHPNCMGQYGTVIDPSTGMPTVNKGNSCTNPSNNTPPWGGGNCTASTGKATCQPGEGPFSSQLYFLITELEQVYSSDLTSTLCVSYPTQAALPAGFVNMGTHSCKGTSWNPSSADGSGLPKGDWCAATNSPATDKCHDAWRSTNFHTFAGANIKMDSSTMAPATCPF